MTCLRLLVRRLVFVLAAGKEYPSYRRLHKRTMVELVSNHLGRASAPL